MNISDLKPTPIYDTYWYFATERQNIFFKRLNNDSYPWTEDQIISKYKFTNAYRASDRVSQYLIRNVIYSDKKYDSENICFRILLFKLFNKIETWEYLENSLGEISYSTFEYEQYDNLLCRRMALGQKIYSAAYVMPSGKSSFGFDKKHQNHLKLLEFMMASGFTREIARAESLRKLYEILVKYPTLGPFLSFQFSIDLNYSDLFDFDEMSFVVAGPGAKNGICKCFYNAKDYCYEDIIKVVAENQEKEFENRELSFKSLFGRRLQLIDCQNLFCEIDKYSRVAYPAINGLDDRKRIKQKYRNINPIKINYYYPPKWKIKLEKNQ